MTSLICRVKHFPYSLMELEDAFSCPGMRSIDGNASKIIYLSRNEKEKNVDTSPCWTKTTDSKILLMRQIVGKLV